MIQTQYWSYCKYYVRGSRNYHKYKYRCNDWTTFEFINNDRTKYEKTIFTLNNARLHNTVQRFNLWTLINRQYFKITIFNNMVAKSCTEQRSTFKSNSVVLHFFFYVFDNFKYFWVNISLRKKFFNRKYLTFVLHSVCRLTGTGRTGILRRIKVVKKMWKQKLFDTKERWYLIRCKLFFQI